MLIYPSLKKTTIVFMLIGFASYIEAAPIYKLTDSTGKIIFTDKDPGLTNTAQYSQEEVTVKEGYKNVTPVTNIGSAYFCGTIKLPIRDVNSTNFYAQVVTSKKSWQREADRLDQEISRLNGRNSRQTGNSTENLDKLSEYHCAESWAEDQKNNAKQEKIALLKKSEGLNTYLQELQEGLTGVCGEEPVYSTDSKLFSERRSAWNRCNSDYSAKMRDIQSDLKKTDQQLLDIKQIEDASR